MGHVGVGWVMQGCHGSCRGGVGWVICVKNFTE